MLRIYPTTTTVKQTVAHLKKKHIADGEKRLPDWVTSGDYGFAVLVDSEGKKKEVSDEITRLLSDGAALSGRAFIVVETVPTTRTISHWKESE